MKNIIVSLILLFSVKVVSAIPVAQDLYKDAQIQENTARDLEGAAQLYQQYLEQPGTDRASQANAYLHLGLCQARLGHAADAKKSWKEIVQDYSDQSTSYAEALNQLQKVQAAEKQDIQASSPVVKIVYAAPPTRWSFEWLDVAVFHSLDSKGEFFGWPGDGLALNLPHSLTYYYRPWLAFGMEGRRLFSTEETFVQNPQNSAPFGFLMFQTITRSVAYLAPIARIEKRLPFGITPFVKLGPAAYRFHFDGDLGSSTKWSPGMTSEAGITLGWSRGFTLSFAYSVLGFVQQTPDVDLTGVSPGPFRDDIGIITQAHGWRWLGGPSFKFGFRW